MKKPRGSVSLSSKTFYIDLKQTESSDIEAAEAHVPVGEINLWDNSTEDTPTPTQDQEISNPTNVKKGRKAGKKWQKVDLNAIAPNAVAPPSHTGNKSSTHQLNPQGRRKRGQVQVPGGISHLLQNPLVGTVGPSNDEDSAFDTKWLKFKTLPAHSNQANHLSVFTKFGELAPELRFKIWRFAARSAPRLLELIWIDGNHRNFRVAPRSNRAPAVMHACQESRWEAQHIYTKYNFTHWGQPITTWFNEDQDIIYFGERACISSVVNFFGCGKFQIPRVAFISSGKLMDCCDFDSDEGDGPDWDNIERRLAVDGGCNIMQALHGIPEDLAGNSLVLGAPYVKDVFFVVKSELMKLNGGEIDSGLTLRPSVHSGLTKRQKWVKETYHSQIQRVRDGLGVAGRVGENRWTDGNHPTFRFVSLAPPLKDGKGKALKHDAIMLPTNEVRELTANRHAFVRSLMQKTGVEIVISEQQYHGEKETEIGLYNGTKESIEEAKKAILKGELDQSDTQRTIAISDYRRARVRTFRN